MKLSKMLIPAVVLALFAGESYADSGSKTTPCYTVGKTITVDSGCTLVVKSGGTLNLNSGSTETNQATKISGGTTDVSGIVMSTAITGNPLAQDSHINTLVSTAGLNSAAMTTLIASTAGKTIYPVRTTIMASGTGATATGLAIECSDGTLIASWPVALLTSLNPLDAYSSTAVARGSALGLGCPASTAVMMSNVGTNITTTTNVHTNVLYTVQ
jgi:hypothetical protein